ncbi:MAG: hypothetical protein ACR2RE_30370, partial [Geminicoccaceae bacterium]
LEEVRESVRLGDGSRGGQDVHLSVDTRVRPTVMPTEITMLKNNHCYVKLTEDQPLALTYVEPRRPLTGHEPTEPFIPWSDDSHMAGEVLKAEGAKLGASASSKATASTPISKETKKERSPKVRADERRRRPSDKPPLRPQMPEQRELFPGSSVPLGQPDKADAWGD